MTSGEGWNVSKTATDPHSIGASNTVFTISNGYMALKGNPPADRSTHASTFINGVFDLADMVAFIRPTRHERRYLDPEHFDSATPSPSIANLPNPLLVRIFVDDREIVFGEAAVEEFLQTYDLRTGVYSCSFEHESADGRRTRIAMRRLCDMVRFHRAAMRLEITPLNYSGRVTLRSGIDGGIRSNLQNDRQFEVLDAGCPQPGRCRLTARTLERGIEVRALTQDVFTSDVPAGRCLVEAEEVYTSYDIDALLDSPVTLEKHIVLACSEDERHGAACDCESELDSAVEMGTEGAIESNRAWWDEIWQRIDVRIGGDDLAQFYLRFCLFHLTCAAPRHTNKLSVPCKLITGEHYQGTTFYDTDLYTEAFYLYTMPEIARSCLNYRHIGLSHAHELARDLGCEGAKFAWQAGPYGEEALGKWWRFTHTNIHIDGDVAYSLMRYWHATGDDHFILDKGIDILVESARFYVSRAVCDESGRCHLINVAGPDEGHCESTNNFYTNLLAKRTLEWAVEVVQLVAESHPEHYRDAVRRLSLADDEPAQWKRVASSLVFYFDPQSKVYEQCEGFYRLLPAPPELLEGRTDWFVTVFPYQALNQPDVVMGMVLLPDEFPDDVKRANWDFYRDKSMDFSSMSFVINAMMAADIGDLDYAYEQFLISAGEDLDEDLTGRRDTSDGIHGTASGGAWMAAVLGFGGVRVGPEGLRVQPRLPKHWTSLRFNMVLRGESVSFDIDHSRVRISADASGALDMPAEIRGQRFRLTSGTALESPLREENPTHEA